MPFITSEQWRNNCLSTPLPLDYGWRPCMFQRAIDHHNAKNFEASLRELASLEIFIENAIRISNASWD